MALEHLDLDALARVITGRQFVFYWCGATVLYFALWLSLFLVRAIGLGRALRKANRPLNAVNDETSFLSAFESYDQAIRALRRLRHPWGEFTESLVFPDASDSSPRIRNTKEPSYYLNDATIIHPTVNLRWYMSIPNQLTAIGILGTFVGLVAGITLAQHGLAGEDIKEVQASLGYLLSGASLAFVTSVFGIFFSLAFLISERFVIRLLHGSLDRWVTGLEARLQLVTPESVMLQQLSENKRQTKQLEAFNTDLIFSLEQALEERVAGKLIPKFEELIVAVQGVRADRSDANEEMLGSIARQFQDSLRQGAGTEIEAVATTLGSLNETLRTSVEAMSRSNSEMQTTMSGVARSLEESVSSSSGVMQQGMRDALTDVAGSVSAATEQMRISLEAAMRGIGEAMASGSAEMQRGVGESLGAASRSLAQATEEMRTVLGAVAEGLRESMSGSSIEMQNTLRSMMSDLASGLQSSGASLARELSDSGTRAAGQIEGSLSAFGEGVERVGQLTSVCENLVLSSQDVVMKVAGLVSELEGAQLGIAKAAEPLRASAESMGRAGNEIVGAIDKVASISGTMTQSIQRLESTQESVTGQWEDYERRFKSVDQSLVRVFEQMDIGLRRYTEQVTSFATELDGQTAKSLQTLSAVAGEFRETLDQLAEELQQQRRG